jgi:hypothetical protein
MFGWQIGAEATFIKELEVGGDFDTRGIDTTLEMSIVNHSDGEIKVTVKYWTPSEDGNVMRNGVRCTMKGWLIQAEGRFDKTADDFTRPLWAGPYWLDLTVLIAIAEGWEHLKAEYVKEHQDDYAI